MSEWEVELDLGMGAYLRARLSDGGLYEIQIKTPDEFNEANDSVATAALTRSQVAILNDSMQRAAGVMP